MKLTSLALVSFVGMWLSFLAVYTWTEPRKAAAHGVATRTREEADDRDAAPPVSSTAPASTSPRPAPRRYLQVGTFPTAAEASAERAKIARAGFQVDVLRPTLDHHVIVVGPFDDDRARLAARSRFLARFPGYDALLRTGDNIEPLVL